MTPEGYVKAAVNRLLAKYKGIYRFMPVPAGYGAPTLDYLVCANGRFIGIETKAPGKKPTGRQRMTIVDILAAGGMCFVIDGIDSPELQSLETYLNDICHCEHQAQGDRSPTK